MGRLWLSVPFLILVAVLGFACGGESNNGDVEKTPIVIYASTPTPIPVTSSDNEFTALRNKVPEPCVGTNMIDVFSATGYMISFDWDTDQYLDAVGVGFVFNGYILTAEHVIDDILENGLSTIWLHVPSEEATSSTMPVGVNVVYSDPENDFALLELDEKSDIKYEDIREVMDEFEIRPLDSEIPNRFLCFFRALYPTWLRAPDVAALPGEYPAAYEWFDLEEGRNFTFDSVVGGARCFWVSCARKNARWTSCCCGSHQSREATRQGG